MKVFSKEEESQIDQELHLTSSAHMNPALVGLVEIPAYIITALTMSMSGRKPIL